MKKFITLLMVALLAVGCCFGLTACGEKEQTAETLIVYTEAGFEPWEFTKKGTTEVVGADIEIAKYIAKKYNYELKIIDGSFDSIIAGISEDNALGIAGISWTSKRAEAIEYSDFYYGDAFQSVVYLKSSNPTLDEDGVFKISNFEGKSVVFQTGTTSQLTIDEKKVEWGIVGNKDYAEVLTALEEVKSANGGKYLIVDSQVAASLVLNNSDCAYATIEGVDAESYGVVAKKGNKALIEKVNVALAELLVKDADGKTQIDKWVEQYQVVADSQAD